MARYRTKDESDLLWNSTRRRITAELRLQIKDFEEAALNKLLSQAWVKHAKALERGEPMVLESHYEQFVATALADAAEAILPVESEPEDDPFPEDPEGSQGPESVAGWLDRVRWRLDT